MNVYEQAASEAARWAKAARVRVRATRAGEAVLASLLDGLDRDIFAETVRDLGLGHQPRERAVTCAVCGRLTWHPHGTCPEHTETCEQCCVPGSLEVTR